jgi:hypothetical protein
MVPVMIVPVLHGSDGCPLGVFAKQFPESRAVSERGPQFLATLLEGPGFPRAPARSAGRGAELAGDLRQARLLARV